MMKAEKVKAKKQIDIKRESTQYVGELFARLPVEKETNQTMEMRLRENKIKVGEQK